MSDESVLPPRIKIRWFFWTFLALFLFVVIGIYSSRMAQNATDYDLKRATDRYLTLNKLRETENQILTTADWIDQDKKIIRIPIDEAMAKEIDTLKSKPLAMCGVIPGTMPPPPPAPMTPTTNAVPAAATPAATGTNAAPASAAQPATPASTNAAPTSPTKPAPTVSAAPAAATAPGRTTRTY